MFNEAAQQTTKLTSQIKDMYGELGTMLAAKQLEMDSKSRFVAQPSEDMKGHHNIEEYALTSISSYFAFLGHYKLSHSSLVKVID